MPAVARLVALAALLLVAAAAHTGVRSGASATWVLLLVAGVALAVVTGAVAHAWPLPAVWLVVTLLAASGSPDVRPEWLVPALVGGGLALAGAVTFDLAPRRRTRRRGGRR
jgi:hypothetical protein